MAATASRKSGPPISRLWAWMLNSHSPPSVPSMPPRSPALATASARAERDPVDQGHRLRSHQTEVAGHRQPAAGADRGAVDRGDGRLGEQLERLGGAGEGPVDRAPDLLRRHRGELAQEVAVAARRKGL